MLAGICYRVESRAVGDAVSVIGSLPFEVDQQAVDVVELAAQRSLVPPLFYARPPQSLRELHDRPRSERGPERLPQVTHGRNLATVAVRPPGGGSTSEPWRTRIPPRGVDLSRYSTVVIWCVRFGVAFGAAELTSQ